MRVYSASNVAACIDANPYEHLCDTIEKLWKKEGRDNYLAAIRCAKPKKSLQKDEQELHTALRSEAGAKMNSIRCDDSMDITEKVNEIAKSNTDELPEHQATLLKRHVRSRAATTHGTKTETKAIDLYAAQKGETVVKCCNAKQCVVRNTVVLTGRIDGMIITPDGQSFKIIEVKNRTRRLFHEVKLYEYIQVQCYLKIFDCAQADLVEHYKGEIDCFTIERDDEFMDEVCNKICAFDQLLNALITSNEQQVMYFGSSDRDEYIRDRIIQHPVQA